MKQFKHLLMAAIALLGLGTASAADGVQTVTDYTCNFNDIASSTLADGFVKGWSVKSGQSTYGSATNFSTNSSKGVDGTKCLYMYSNYSDNPALVITPRVTGKASIKWKAYSSYSSPVLKFYKVSYTDGAWVVGDEIVPDTLPTPGTSDFVTIEVPAQTSQNIAIYAEKSYLDDFAADAVEIDLYKSLKVLSCTTTTGTTTYCDENGNYTVKITGKIYNNGDLAINPGDAGYSYSLMQYNKTDSAYETKAIDQTMNPGDTIDVEIEHTFNYAQNPSRMRYDLYENVKSTFAYGSWVEPVAYEPIMTVYDENRNNLSTASYAATFGAYGMLNAATSKKLVVGNTGGKAMQVKINVPEGFTVTKSEFTVAGQGTKDTVEVTATAAAAGVYSGTLEVINVEKNDTVKVALSATVLDPSKYYEPFTDNASETALPAGWYEPAQYGAWKKTNFTNGANNSVYSGYVDPYILCSPKLKVAAGEKMTFAAAKRSTSSYVNVYYSADRKNWTKAKTVVNADLSATSYSTSSTGTTTWATFVVDSVPAGEWYIGFEGGYVGIDDVYGYEKVAVAHDVVFVKTKVPAQGMVNTNYEASATLLNVNSVKEEGKYYVNMYVGEDSKKNMTDGEAMEASAQAEYALNYYPDKAGTYPVYFKAVWNDGYEIVSDTVQVTFVPESASADYVVGSVSGTNTTPLNLSYYNSKSETVYTAAQLSAAGLKAGDKISSLSYYGYKTSAEHSANVVVYVKNTDDTAFGTIAWCDTTTMTKVFDSEVTFPVAGTQNATVEMLKVTFAEPFVYTGGALRVQMSHTSSAWKSVYFEYDATYADQCYGQKNDNTKPDAMTISTTAWRFPVTHIGIQQTPDTLKGKVVDKDGKPLAGVKVELVSRPAEDNDNAPAAAPASKIVMEPSAYYEGVTDENGEYAVAVIQSSKSYMCTYTLAGYETVQIERSEFGQVEDVVMEKETPTGINDVNATKSNVVRKVIENGRIVIYNGDVKYDITGARIK